MSEIVTKFTEYHAAVPDFFIDTINAELEFRDQLNIFIEEKSARINVSGDHPLVKATGVALNQSTAEAKAAIAGFLPAIAVTELDETESDVQTMGQGTKTPRRMTQEWITTIRNQFPKRLDRYNEGIITDRQLSEISSAIDSVGEPLFAEREGWWIDEGVTIGLWTSNLIARQILGRVLRSILFNMRRAMVHRNLHNIRMQTGRGFINMDFGRIMFGQETTITFQNFFSTTTVYRESFNTGNLISHQEYFSADKSPDQQTPYSGFQEEQTT